MTGCELPVIASAAGFRAAAHIAQADTSENSMSGPLTVNFQPLAAEAVENFIRRNGLEQFTWLEETTYRFEALYYSHSRMARSKHKAHDMAACRKILEDTLDPSVYENMGELEEDIVNQAKRNLLKEVRDELRSLQATGRDWGVVASQQLAKYGLTKIKGGRDDSPETLAAKIVTLLFSEKGRSYHKHVKSRIVKSWTERACKAIEESSTEPPDKVLALAVREQVEHSKDVSVKVPYQIQFTVFVINQDSILMKWREVRREVERDYDDRYRRNVEIATTAVSREGITEGMRVQAAELETRNETVREDLARELETVDSFYTTLLQRAQGLKLIGRFSMSALGATEEASRGIRYPGSTVAQLEGIPSIDSDGSLRVHLKWAEDTPSYLPLANKLSHSVAHTETGNLIFTTDGQVRGQAQNKDKLLRRFLETSTREVIRHGQETSADPLTITPRKLQLERDTKHRGRGMIQRMCRINRVRLKETTTVYRHQAPAVPQHQAPAAPRT